MRWPWILLALSLLVLQGNLTRAAPSPRNEDMFRELMKLDQIYSSIARPSVRSAPLSTEVGPKVQRALNMLRLQELDRLYADRARPRFGKRAGQNGIQSSNSYPASDYETQFRDRDLAGWIPLRR